MTSKGQIEAGEIIIITTPSIYADTYICDMIRARRAISADEWNAVRGRFLHGRRAGHEDVNAHKMIAEMARLGMIEAVPFREMHADDRLEG